MHLKFSPHKLLYKRIIYMAVTLLFLSFSSLNISAEPGAIQIKQEMEWNAFDASQWQSPIVTLNGNIYYVWVNNKLQTMIAKKSSSGKVTSTVIHNNTDKNKHHTLPSLGIDKDGYIHVAYNMHQSRIKEGKFGWQYKKSNKPNSISAFTFIGENSTNTIPGKFITYPSFVTDRKNDLYVAFRHRTPSDGNFNRVGSQGLGIAKYNTNTKTWKMLGGTNYKHKEKTFFWSDSTRISNSKPIGYHSYLSDIFFDRKNRMHISWDVFIKPGEGRSHIMYAYSDDGGNTFKKANGQLIRSLPITPQNGDIVEQSSRGVFRSQSNVGVTSKGQPIVSFQDTSKANKAFFKIWNGNNWTARKEFPAVFPPIILSDSNGDIITISKKNFHISTNDGNTWKAYPMPLSIETSSISFDYEYFRDTRKLRFQAVTGNKIKIFTATTPNSAAPFNQNRSSTLKPPTKLQLKQ